MKKINLFALALTGLCASNAHAGSWQKIQGGSGPYMQTTANIDRAVNANEPIDQPRGADPYDLNPRSETTFFTFRFSPDANNPNETAPTSVSATHVYSFLHGPVEATNVGQSRSFAMARLSPYPDINASSYGPSSVPLPSTVKTQNIYAGTYTGTVPDPNNPGMFIPAEFVDVHATVSAFSYASADIYPGASAKATVNNAAIRTDDAFIPDQQEQGG